MGKVMRWICAGLGAVSAMGAAMLLMIGTAVMFSGRKIPFFMDGGAGVCILFAGAATAVLCYAFYKVLHAPAYRNKQVEIVKSDRAYRARYRTNGNEWRWIESVRIMPHDGSPYTGFPEDFLSFDEAVECVGEIGWLRGWAGNKPVQIIDKTGETRHKPRDRDAEENRARISLTMQLGAYKARGVRR